MKKLLSAATLATSMFVSAGVAAAPIIIDTNATWDGEVNTGWYGSGQSLTVDLVRNTLVSIGFYFDEASYGQTFDFTLSDAANGGSSLFATSFVVASGINIINVNQSLNPGSMVFALLDYNGFSGRTAHFSNTDGYAAGNSLFGDSGYLNYPEQDHRFIAIFDGEAESTPEPESLGVMGLALAALALARKKQVA